MKHYIVSFIYENEAKRIRYGHYEVKALSASEMMQKFALALDLEYEEVRLMSITSVFSEEIPEDNSPIIDPKDEENYP